MLMLDMRCILQTPRRAFFFAVVPSPDPIAPPFNAELFPCLLWDAIGSSTPDQRFALADALVAGGCRYLVCGGYAAERWELAGDDAFVMRYLDAPAEVLEAAHVMTTSHDGEPESDVVRWLVNNTNFDYHDFARLLVLQVGADAKVEQRLCDAMRHEGGMEIGPERQRPSDGL
jgi:hypothetical protein